MYHGAMTMIETLNRWGNAPVFVVTSAQGRSTPDERPVSDAQARKELHELRRFLKRPSATTNREIKGKTVSISSTVL